MDSPHPRTSPSSSSSTQPQPTNKGLAEEDKDKRPLPKGTRSLLQSEGLCAEGKGNEKESDPESDSGKQGAAEGAPSLPTTSATHHNTSDDKTDTSILPPQLLFIHGPHPVKSTALFSTTFIKAGTPIYAEPPLLTMPRYDPSSPDRSLHPPRPTVENAQLSSLLSQLPPPQREQFLSLAYARGLRSGYLLLDIWRTNQIGIGYSKANSHERDDGAAGDGACSCCNSFDKWGVFPTIARLNHACTANVEYTWHEASGTLRVQAVKDIQAGEELVSDYLPVEMWAQSLEERRALIERNFGFRCQCHVCGLRGDELVDSNRRRARFGQLWGIVTDAKLRGVGPSAEVLMRHLREMMTLLREEGEGDWKGAEVLWFGFLLCRVNGDLARAGKFAELTARWRERCRGSGYDGFEGDRKLITNPLEGWYMTPGELWKTRVEEGVEVGSEGFERWLWMRTRGR